MMLSPDQWKTSSSYPEKFEELFYLFKNKIFPDMSLDLGGHRQYIIRPDGNGFTEKTVACHGNDFHAHRGSFSSSVTKIGCVKCEGNSCSKFYPEKLWRKFACKQQTTLVVWQNGSTMRFYRKNS